MKKTIKRVLLIIAATFIVFAGIFLCYAFPLLTMNPVETGPISGTGIYAVKNAINTVFFIQAGSEYIMIDAGSDLTGIETSLKEAGINTGDVKWIFLTHSDSDHVAALPLFPNAEIYMSKDELPLINGTMKRSIFGGNSMPAGIDIDKIILLSDTRELSFNGIKITCIQAPGHTSGSMLYLVDERYLFTGDAFKMSDGNRSVHPFTMDAKLSKKTLEQLKGIINDSPMVFTAHYGFVNNAKK